MNRKIIEFKNLEHIYNAKSDIAFKALSGADGIVSEGEIYSVIGNTGSGKSTLIQHFNALLRPSNGEIIIYNYTKNETYKISHKTRKIKKVKRIRGYIGLVFQFPEYQLFKETVESDIAFGPIQMGVKKAVALKQAAEYLKLVGLPTNLLKRSPFSLSGGQKRRVAIAGILAMKPQVLILDEPIAGLDPQGETEMMSLFQSINTKTNTTIIIVTHNMNHVLEYTNRVFVVHEGKVIKDDSPHAVFSNDELLRKTNLEAPLVYKFIAKLSKIDSRLGKIQARNCIELSSEIGKILKEGFHE